MAPHTWQLMMQIDLLHDLQTVVRESGKDGSADPPVAVQEEGKQGRQHLR